MPAAFRIIGFGFKFGFRFNIRNSGDADYGDSGCE
jgi:hypothetical protein